MSNTAFALDCTNLEDAFELELTGLGRVYFLDFEDDTSATASAYTLFNGVCLLADDGWQVESETILVTLEQNNFFVSAQNVNALVFNWQLQAESLEAFNDTLVLNDMLLKGESITGEAEKATFDIPSGNITLSQPIAQTNALTVQGSSAQLNGNTIIFEDAIATTCACVDGALYVLTADKANFDYEDESIALTNSQLLLGELVFQLDDLDLSQANFESLSFPLKIEYLSDNQTTGETGTGLGISIPSLQASENLKLELGVLGLDADYPLAGILLAHYKDDRVTFDVGHAARGPQADFSITEPVNNWLSAQFAMRNRHWKAQDFVHDAHLALKAKQALPSLANNRFGLEAELLSAVSSQTVSGDPVLDTRLAASISLSHQTPTSPLGQLSSSLKLQNTTYPIAQTNQYGVTFKSQWNKSLSAGSRITLSHTQLWTNSASPFSNKLDKLEPKSLLAFSLSSSEAVSETVQAKLNLGVSYNFLSAAQTWQQFQSLNASVSLAWQQNGITVRPNLETKLASLINPKLDEAAFLQAGLNLETNIWELGFAARYNYKDYDFDKVETSFAFPLDFGAVYLKPFVALDILPSVTSAALPRVSGHGLEATFNSCCGNLNIAYRQLENKFTTSISLSFNDDKNP